MRVTFRADFQGRKGKLAVIGYAWPNPPVEHVEVFRKADKWFARALPSKNVYSLPDGATKGTMTDTVEAAFEKQLTKWAMFDPDGKPLDPARVDEDPNGNFTLREETHVGALAQPPELANGKQNRFLTFCGKTVSVLSILSTRGRKAPDCQVCRTHWEKTPEGERLKQA